MKSRTKARSVALQVLYELDLTEHGAGSVLDARLLETPLDASQEEFTRKIVTGIAPIRTALDEQIAQHAAEWPIDQISIIDRNLLRIAIWEFAVYEDTPIKVAINEAVELAKKFGSDSTPRFVNGVLGSLSTREADIRVSLKNYLDQQKD